MTQAVTLANAGVQGSAKAWVNFNGQGGATIRSSYNVSSVTRTASGRYTVNFTNAFANTNYCTNYSIQFVTGVNFLDNIGMGDVTTTSVSFVVYEAGVYYDVFGFNVVINAL